MRIFMMEFENFFLSKQIQMIFFNSNDVKMYLINILNKSKILKYFNFQRVVFVDDDVDNFEKEE